MTFDESEESSTVTNAHSHGFHSDRERVAIPRGEYPSISVRHPFFRHFSFLKSANRKPENSDDTQRVKFRVANILPPPSQARLSLVSPLETETGQRDGKRSS